MLRSPLRAPHCGGLDLSVCRMPRTGAPGGLPFWSAISFVVLSVASHASAASKSKHMSLPCMTCCVKFIAATGGHPTDACGFSGAPPPPATSSTLSCQTTLYQETNYGGSFWAIVPKSSVVIPAGTAPTPRLYYSIPSFAAVGGPPETWVGKRANPDPPPFLSKPHLRYGQLEHSLCADGWQMGAGDWCMREGELRAECPVPCRTPSLTVRAGSQTTQWIRSS